VKKILIEMEDQKQTYEQKAKEALQKMLEDKLQTEQQLQNSQRSLAATREDAAFWKEHYTTLKAELTKMTTAHAELKNSFHILQSELQQADTQNTQLCQVLRSLQSEHTALQQRASALREDNDLKAEHISAIEGTACRGNGGCKENTLKIPVHKAKYTRTLKARSLRMCCMPQLAKKFLVFKGPLKSFPTRLKGLREAKWLF
uniref:Uncharacterized protein n=1 Tax=Buteo japonicus TaxID=224669 RepID=A0A8C0HRK2_9AVES